VIDINNCSAPILNIVDTIVMPIDTIVTPTDTIVMPIDSMEMMDTITSIAFINNHFNCEGNDFKNGFKVFPTFHSNDVNLQFCLASESKVSILAYDLNGQYLDTVIEDRVLEGGTHQIPFYTERFPLGVYFYVLEIGGVKVRTLKAVKL